MSARQNSIDLDTPRNVQWFDWLLPLGFVAAMALSLYAWLFF